MRSLSFLVLLVVALASCKQVNPEHEFYISGILMDNCQHQNPVGGVEIQFDVSGRTYATTTTNAFGEFELSGTAVERGGMHENEPFLAINFTAQDNGGFRYKKLARLPFEGAVLDTLYYYGTTNVELKVESGMFPSSNKDTLFVYYPFPYDENPEYRTSSFGDEYVLKYAGPFSNGVIDSLLMASHPHPVYHNDISYPVTYWVNSYQDWRRGYTPEKSFRITYSGAGIQEKPIGGCDETLSATISLK